MSVDTCTSDPKCPQPSAQLIEPHILDFQGDLYGRPITVEFIEYLRPMQHFSSKADLIAAVQKNIQQARMLSLPK
jgi:riboflavin kinase/FMN adenylyltransferase